MTTALALHGVIQFASNAWRAVFHRMHVAWPVLLWFGIGAAVSIGFFSLVIFAPTRFYVFLGLGLMPILVWLPEHWLTLDATNRWHALGGGFVSTGIALVAGVSGPVTDLLFIRTKLNRHQVVATKAVMQAIGHASKILVYGGLLLGARARAIIPLPVTAIAVLASMAGIVVGGYVLDRISDAHFRSSRRWIVTIIGATFTVQGGPDRLCLKPRLLERHMTPNRDATIIRVRRHAHRRRARADCRGRLPAARRQYDPRKAARRADPLRPSAHDAHARTARARRHVWRDPDRSLRAAAPTLRSCSPIQEGYSTMCGHATIAIGRWAVDSGRIRTGRRQGELRPRGHPAASFASTSKRATAKRPASRSKASYPSPTPLDRAVDVPGLGTVRVDIAFGGAFYAILPASRIGLSLIDTPLADLVTAATAISKAIRAGAPIVHPHEPDLGFLYGTILTDDVAIGAHGGQPSYNLCIFADGQIDRSPTGSGVDRRASRSRHRRAK